MKQKIKLILSILTLLSLVLARLYWLAAGITILAGLYLLYNSNLKLIAWFRRNRFTSAIAVILFILTISISARVFFIEIFAIPSGSMEETLKGGDKVLVNKLNYGPSMPRSPFDVPWFNLVWYLQAKAGTKTDSAHWDFRRLNGYSKVKHNDIVVFLHPLWGKKDNFFIKRCTGLPGDTLRIVNGMVFANGQELPMPDNLKLRYRVKVNGRDKFQRNAETMGTGVTGIYPGREINRTELVITRGQGKQLAERKEEFGIDSIDVVTVTCDSLNWVNPKSREFSWTIDNYGPVIIPGKGMTIEFNQRNYRIYQRTVNLLEKQKLKQKNGIFYLNDKPATAYTFRHDYYFMMGDNRGDSNDSRYWGFVPEENIVGKAVVVLFSNDEEGFRWRRVFKVIR